MYLPSVPPNKELAGSFFEGHAAWDLLFQRNKMYIRRFGLRLRMKPLVQQGDWRDMVDLLDCR